MMQPARSVSACAQVLNFLQGGNMDILVAGDSMMRQLYIRLVHMMRGSRRVLDYHIHTHANYAVRRTAWRQIQLRQNLRFQLSN